MHAHRLALLSCFLITGLLADGAWFGSLAAQRVVAVKGTILEDSTNLPLVQAEILFLDLGRRAQTDQAGRFLVDSLFSGEHRILVRAIGYEPINAIADLRPIDTLEVTFHLAPSPQRLPTVEGRTRAIARLRDVERRRASLAGGFLFREDLERRVNSRMSDVLRSIPGLQISSFNGIADRMVSNGRANGDAPCWSQVLLDGITIYDPTANTGALPPNLDLFSPREFEAIEYYRGAAETPVEYLSPAANCGTLLLWSRSPTPSRD